MNLNLTVEQKLHYYRLALNYFRAHPDGPFICNVLYSYLIIDGKLTLENEYDYNSTMVCRVNFPEFYSQLKDVPMEILPNNDIGNCLREEFLNNAIKILENENRID